MQLQCTCNCVARAVAGIAGRGAVSSARARRSIGSSTQHEYAKLQKLTPEPRLDWPEYTASSVCRLKWRPAVLLRRQSPRIRTAKPADTQSPAEKNGEHAPELRAGARKHRVRAPFSYLAFVAAGAACRPITCCTCTHHAIDHVDVGNALHGSTDAFKKLEPPARHACAWCTGCRAESRRQTSAMTASTSIAIRQWGRAQLQCT